MIFCENMESKWPLIYTWENQLKVLWVKYKLKSPSSLYVDELNFLMMAKWKKRCLCNYSWSVAHSIFLYDRELKHFTAITVPALVVNIIIQYLCIFNTCVPNQIKVFPWSRFHIEMTCTTYYQVMRVPVLVYLFSLFLCTMKRVV